MKPTKQTVYLPVKIGNDTNTGLIVKYIRSGHKYPIEEQQAFVFTPEQLNEYTQSVIKQALETAAKKANMKCKRGHSVEFAEHWSVNKQSITNTLEETCKKFEV
jgi:hypothetical protein